MGLLDDAIREHLDLKRARGGDPAEIERMEREALGPVRREPTIGSPRIGALDEHAPLSLDSEYRGDHPADLEELQDRGYHDSTAPHPNHEHLDPHQAHADGHFGLGNDQVEQPRRRFLRRNRPASFSEPVLPPDPGYDDIPGLADHEPLEHYEPLAHPEPPVEHYEPLAHPEPPVEHYEPLIDDRLPPEPLGHDEPSLEHYEPPAHDELPLEPNEPLAHQEPLHEPLPENPATPEQAGQPGIPPHLQFERPPKRPSFSAEPPDLHPDADEQASASEHPTELHAAAAPQPPATPQSPEPPEHDPEVQETTEFDVEKHIAETRHLPDEVDSAGAPPPAPEPPAPPQPAPEPPAPPRAAPDPLADEDVLEETPEFLQDTPEHDRLWFEQRPPKDFDFDG
jgi:hypothetical protein